MAKIQLSCAISPCLLLLLSACGASDERGDSPAGASIPGAGGALSGSGGYTGLGGMQVPGSGGASVGGGSSSGAGGGSASGGAMVGPPGHEGPGIAMDECNLSTGFVGDDFCILPPPVDEGFQLHVGPTDYDDPDQLFVLEPGQEATTDFPAVSGNDVDRFFYYRQYRMRPTAHHMIVTVENGGIFAGAGRRIATANLSQDFPASGEIPPEDAGVGSPIAARSNLNVSLHAINTTDQPQIRELWVNFWYRDAAQVTAPAVPWFKMGSVSFSVAPHTEAVLGPYSCEVEDAGRLLWLYGHRHANNVRFTTSRVRGAQRDIIYEGFEWEEPLQLEYSSLVTNPVPDRATHREGGWSGILDLLPGDRIEWECHVVNQLDTALGFANETFTAEMCILDAEAVGTACRGF